MKKLALCLTAVLMAAAAGAEPYGGFPDDPQCENACRVLCQEPANDDPMRCWDDCMYCYCWGFPGSRACGPL